jgi:membrane protease YdiL (CAAX protease family)
VKTFGWVLYSAGVVSLLFTKEGFGKHLGLVFFSLAFLGLVPITTDTSNENFIRMGVVLGLAVLMPYIFFRWVFKDSLVIFRYHHGRKWFKKEVLYIVFTAVLAYLVIPFYLTDSGAYLNWTVERSSESIGRLFVGTNVLGIWDELFFISTVLGILRHYMKFSLANMFQAILFTSFLFELGFRGWGPFIIFPFALLQGYVFRKTDSLFYVITIHLIIDFILFLALINAHHPDLINIFIT